MMPSTIKLGDAAITVDYGVTASASDSPVGPKFLRITDIQNGHVDWNAVPWCEANTKTVMGSRLESGDIVFARTGATTGKSFLIRECPDNSVFASYLIRLRLKDSFDPRFVSHFFQTPDYWAQITKSARGVAQPGVNATTLKSLDIPTLPLSEQKRIAEILDRAEALRAKRRAALALLDELTQSIFLDMFGDPAANLKGWEMRPVGELATKFSDGPFGSNLKSDHYTENGVRVIRLQNIGVGEFIDNDKAFVSPQHYQKLAKHNCRPGDVIIGTMGEPNVRACILPNHIEIALNKADCIQCRPERSVANAEFICALLNQPSLERMAQSRMQGQTRTRISMGRLRELLVPLPPVALQELFKQKVAACTALKNTQMRDLAVLDQLFASLQHRAFRGEL